MRVQRNNDATQPHTVYIEVWRSWGQTPLRGVAVDALPPAPWPRWPGVALLLLAGWLGLVAAQTSQLLWRMLVAVVNLLTPLRRLRLPARSTTMTQSLAGVALVLLVYGVWSRHWLITDVALTLLAWCSLQRPALWIAALLLGLPFYYTYTLPILPTRAFSFIDIGILGGLLVLSGHWLLTRIPQPGQTNARGSRSRQQS